MKFFVYLFSLCILTLSCMSCKDYEEFSEVKTNQANYALHKGDHHGESDNCSPMCTCSCCGLSMVHLLPVQDFDFLKPVAISKKKNLHKDQFISRYHHRIWQPPKFHSFIS